MRHTVSLVISFYNESKNIKSLTEIVKKIKSKNDNLIEVIIAIHTAIKSSVHTPFFNHQNKLKIK